MAATRTYVISDAAQDHIPLMIGLCGSSNGGKTRSALRLATGIAAVSNGPIVLIDTENKRGLHHAKLFKFKHLPFDPPHSSLDYIGAIDEAAKLNPSVIIIDSASHEHEGTGGLLDWHEKELDRLAGDDFAKRKRCGALAWAAPKAGRRKLTQKIMQTKTNFIFCFRADKTLDWKNKLANGEPRDLGWQPVGTNAWKYEMAAMLLFTPGSKGVPTFNPTVEAEKDLVKIPDYLEHIFSDGRQIDEAHGEALAKWSCGGGDVAHESAPSNPASDFDQFKAVLRGEAEFCKAAKEIPKSSLNEFLKTAFDGGWDMPKLLLEAKKAALPATEKFDEDTAPFGQE